MSHQIAALVPASEDDAEDLAELRVRAMQPSLERIGRFDPQRARERFLVGFSASHTRHIVAGAQRVGVVVVRTSEDQLVLDHLYVQPEHQGQGIGAAVLGLVFTEADARGMSIRVGALRESKSNDFYVQHGFKLVEQTEWDNYYVRPAASAP